MLKRKWIRTLAVSSPDIRKPYLLLGLTRPEEFSKNLAATYSSEPLHFTSPSTLSIQRERITLSLYALYNVG